MARLAVAVPDTRRRTFNVLFLCTGNSARSILAEVILNDLGQGRFRAYSAGSNPVGKVNPMTLALLRERGHSVAGLRSKSWDEFARPGAPRIDIILTVCDSAAKERCPVWPGQPVSAHWGIPDPAAVDGGAQEKGAAFDQAYDTLRTRIGELCRLPLDMDDVAALQSRLSGLGRSNAMDPGRV